MKTNFMIALKEPQQWKAPWRTPVRIVQMSAEGTIRNRMRTLFQDTVKKNLRDFEDIIKKHWLHD